MKQAIILILLMLFGAALMAGCTAEQRKHCAFCRFVAGEWVCEDANAPEPVEP